MADLVTRIARTCATRRHAIGLAAAAAAGLALSGCSPAGGAGEEEPARDGYGLVDSSGEWVLEPTYEWVGPFREGRSAVVTSDGETRYLGLVGADGALVADPVEASPSACGLSQGLMPVRFRQRARYVNSSGAWDLDEADEPGASYHIAGPFSPADAFCAEPYAFLLYYSGEDIWGENWGVLGAGGEWIVEPRFADVVQTHSGARPATDVGLAPAKSRDYPGLWGFVDSTGSWAVGPAFSDASWFHGDLAAACDPEGGLWGTVDASGAWALPASYASVSFADGWPALARDAAGGLWGVAGPSGWAAGPAWRSFGLTDSTDALPALDDATGLWGLASPDGSWAVAPAWSDVDARSGLRGGLLIARDAGSGLWGVTASDGSWAVAPELSGVWADASLSFPMAARDAGSGLWGYLAKDGSWVIEPALSVARPFSEGLAAASPAGSGRSPAPDNLVRVDGAPVPRSEDLPANYAAAHERDKDLALVSGYNGSSDDEEYDWLFDWPAETGVVGVTG